MKHYAKFKSELSQSCKTTMPQVKAQSQHGNSKWFAHADVTDAQMETLADLGFLWVMQRTPSTRAEKAQAGYEKRPDGFKRSDIPYNDANIATLKRELQRPVEIADGDEITPIVDKAEFYEIGAASAPKFADERGIVAKYVKGGNVPELASKIGYTGDTVAHDGEPTTAFLQAIKVFKNQMLANAFKA